MLVCSSVVDELEASPMNEMIIFFKAMGGLGVVLIILVLCLKWAGAWYLERKLMRHLDPRRKVASEQAKELTKWD